MVCRPCLLCNFCVYECNISALIFVVRGMYGYYFLLGVVLGILLGEVDELELPFHPLLLRARPRCHGMVLVSTIVLRR